MSTFAKSLAVAITVVATPALADDVLVGQTCATSAECGSLKCIDKRCRDVDAILRGHDTSVSLVSVGHVAMFGNGNGYGKVIASTDIVATLAEPLLVLATISSRGSTASILGVVSFVPAGLGGSIVHAAFGRAIPAVISFFAWTSLAASTFAVGGIFGLAFDNGFEFNDAAAWAAGLTFGALGAAGLTALDVFMARKVSPPSLLRRTTRIELTPGVTPTHGGAIASLGGSW